MLDWQQGLVRFSRQPDAYGISGADIAVGEHGAQDAGLMDQSSSRILIERRGQQALLKALDLDTRISP